MSCPCLVKLDLARIFARKSSQLKFLKALKKNKKLIFKSEFNFFESLEIENLRISSSFLGLSYNFEEIQRVLCVS